MTLLFLVQCVIVVCDFHGCQWCLKQRKRKTKKGNREKMMGKDEMTKKKSNSSLVCLLQLTFVAELLVCRFLPLDWTFVIHFYSQDKGFYHNNHTIMPKVGIGIDYIYIYI